MLDLCMFFIFWFRDGHGILQRLWRSKIWESNCCYYSAGSVAGLYDCL